MPANISAAALKFLRWWGSELKGLLPRSMRTPRGRTQRRLVLSVEGARFRLFAERGQQREELPLGGADGEDGARDEALLRLAEAAKARPGTSVGLRFGAEDCFARSLQLPAAAERDFGRILDLDLERTTPFRRDDVLTAHYIDTGTPAGRGRLSVRQLVIKRRSIEPLLRRMHDLGLAPSFADCWDANHGAGLPVDFLGATPGRASRNNTAAKLVPAMAVLAVVLVISALTIFIIRRQNALEQLQTQVATARGEAQKVRHAFESANEVYRQIAAVETLVRERVSVARIIEELTGVLPDSAWIYDLRVDGGTVEFTGFARSAAALIPLLERSKMFTAATLTAPVVLDGGEDKERFSIRVRVRDVPGPKSENLAQEPGKGDL